MSTETPSVRRRAGRRNTADGGSAGLTTADLIVLGLLSERAMHGYELLREYERQEVEDWALVSRPHVYYALKKLAGRGLLAAARGAGRGARGRSVFTVTPAGAEALAQALTDPGWATTRPPAPFTTWLGLSIHARPADRDAVITARRRFLGDEIARERATLTAIELDQGARVGVAAAMVTLVLRQFATELAWLDELEVALTSGLDKN